MYMYLKNVNTVTSRFKLNVLCWRAFVAFCSPWPSVRNYRRNNTNREWPARKGWRLAGTRELLDPLCAICTGAPAASAGLSLVGFLSIFAALIFLRARVSAARILFSSSESLATSFERYSCTVFQPPSDLFAILMSLLRLLNAFRESSISAEAIEIFFSSK